MPKALADQLLERHDAVHQLERLQAILEDEHQRRKDFYEWVTEDFKAEFINGKIVVHSPVKKRHWSVNDLLSTLLSVYTRKNNLGKVGTEKVMISLTRNDYEPDLVFFSKEKAANFEDDQVLFPAPDFVVEILSKSTAKTDKTVKKDDYALHGIKEYWIIDPIKQRVHQFILPDGALEYFPAKVHQSSGFIESYAIKGFNIPVAAIFDEASNMKSLQELMK